MRSMTPATKTCCPCARRSANLAVESRLSAKAGSAPTAYHSSLTISSKSFKPISLGRNLCLLKAFRSARCGGKHGSVTYVNMFLPRPIRAFSQASPGSSTLQSWMPHCPQQASIRHVLLYHVVLQSGVLWQTDCPGQLAPCMRARQHANPTVCIAAAYSSAF